MRENHRNHGDRKLCPRLYYTIILSIDNDVTQFSRKTEKFDWSIRSFRQWLEIYGFQYDQFVVY